MIRIVGTGHIFEKSVRDIKDALDGRNTDIVAVELDRKRFAALEGRGWRLESSGEDINLVCLLKQVLRGGSLLILLEGSLALIQHDLGRRFGIHPGSDMLAAVQSARAMGCRIALIDRDIEITLNHLLSIPLKEKLRLFSRSSGDMEVLGSTLGTNVEGILDDEKIEKILEELKTRLPTLYSALVDERDRYMAYALLRLQERYPEANITAVVGAGHGKGIKFYLGNPEKIDTSGFTELHPVSRLQLLLLTLPLLLTYILMKIKFRIRK